MRANSFPLRVGIIVRLIAIVGLTLAWPPAAHSESTSCPKKDIAASLPIDVATSDHENTGVPGIILIPGTVPTTYEIDSAIRQALIEKEPTSVDAYAVTDVHPLGDDLFVSVVGLRGLTDISQWNIEDNGVWFGLLLLVPTDQGGWLGAVEGSSKFSELIWKIPNSLLTLRSKQDLDSNERSSLPQDITNTYLFPWQPGSSMQYGSLGVHDNGFSTGWKAVDFLSDGNTGVGHAPNRLLAAAGGSISYKCNPSSGQNTTAIRIDNVMYTHLLNSSNLYVGKTFSQGEEMGQMRAGSFGENCGYASQGSGWFHVHLGFPNTGSFGADGWTLSFSDQMWRRGSDVRGISSWFVAESGSAPPPVDTTPPSGAITAPSEGATIASRSVQLSGWASDSGSGVEKAHLMASFNGIQRQIGPYFFASPFNYYWDMCNDVVPNGQQISLTIEAWDKAGNKATAPGGIRHFYKNYNCGSSSDTTPPTGGITAPAEGTAITNRTAYLSGWASDSGSGFARAHFMASFNGIQRQIGPDFTGSPFSFSWDMCDADSPIGQIGLTLEAWDMAGNKATAPGGTRRFTKDYTCPTAPPPAGSCDPSSDGVHLFQDENFQGECQSFSADNPDLNGSRIGNNTASSIEIVGPYEAWLYKSQNYQEGESHFESSDGNLADESCGDNNVSSIKVKRIVCNPGPTGVTLYADKDFKGNCETFTADDPDLNGNSIGNNRASSLTVIGDWRVCLYRSQNYAEGESCFGSDVADLTNEPVGNDNASSVRVTPITCYNLNAVVNQTVGGSVSVSPTPNCGTRYLAGTVVQFAANAATGYSFTNWTGGTSGLANPVSVTMDGNKTVTANFTADPVCFTLTTSANPSGAGSVGANPAPNCGSRYTAGTAVQLTANANAGHSFVNWSGTASGSATTTAVTMDRDKAVVANFAATKRVYMPLILR